MPITWLYRLAQSLHTYPSWGSVSMPDAHMVCICSDVLLTVLGVQRLRMGPVPTEKALSNTRNCLLRRGGAPGNTNLQMLSLSHHQTRDTEIFTYRIQNPALRVLFGGLEGKIRFHSDSFQLSSPC